MSACLSNVAFAVRRLTERRTHVPRTQRRRHDRVPHRVQRRVGPRLHRRGDGREVQGCEGIRAAMQAQAFRSFLAAWTTPRRSGVDASSGERFLPMDHAPDQGASWRLHDRGCGRREGGTDVGRKGRSRVGWPQEVRSFQVPATTSRALAPSEPFLARTGTGWSRRRLSRAQRQRPPSRQCPARVVIWALPPSGWRGHGPWGTLSEWAGGSLISVPAAFAPMAKAWASRRVTTLVPGEAPSLGSTAPCRGDFKSRSGSEPDAARQSWLGPCSSSAPAEQCVSGGRCNVPRRTSHAVIGRRQVRSLCGSSIPCELCSVRTEEEQLSRASHAQRCGPFYSEPAGEGALADTADQSLGLLPGFEPPRQRQSIGRRVR